MLIFVLVIGFLIIKCTLRAQHQEQMDAINANNPMYQEMKRLEQRERIETWAKVFGNRS